MGRRQITTQKTETVAVCDLCDKAIIGSSPQRCHICNREIGYCCRKFSILSQDRDVYVTACKECDAAGESIKASMRAMAEAFDAGMKQFMSTWKALVSADKSA